MKEQSHKEEMSAAIRGDFERLRARGVPAALVPQDAKPSEEDAPAQDVHRDARGEEPPARRTWVSRLTGR